jgi:predicted porin
MISKKKFLLPLSVLAFCGASNAQAAVKLYGIADLSLAHAKGSLDSTTQVISGGLNTSRIGFHAVEDLGGGLSAVIVLEAGYESDSGTGQSTNTNNQRSGNIPAGGLTFNRRSTLSLLGSWGEIRLGRDKVPQYLNLEAGAPLGVTGVGTAISHKAMITGVTAVRASNSIAYHSPQMLGGLGVNVMHYRGENGSGTPTSDDGNGGGIRLTYESGPFFAGLATGRTNYAAGDTQQRNLAVSWDFGVAKLMGAYNNDRAGSLAARGAVVGVLVPVASNGVVRAAYSFHRTNAAGGPEAKMLALGYVHDLSKRTALYVTAAHVINSGGSSQALLNITTAPNESSSGYALGIRQNF